MKKEVLIAIIVVAVLIVGGVSAVVIMNNNNSSIQNGGTFTAETSYAEKLSTTAGLQTASSGKVFVLAVVTITNEDVSGGITNDVKNFYIESNRITYTSDSFVTYYLNHEYRYSEKIIGKGASDTSCYVFEIPKNGIDTAEIIYKGECKVTGKTTYSGEAKIKPMGTYEIIASCPESLMLKDGTEWFPESGKKFLTLKVTMTCNFDKISTRWSYFDVLVGVEQYWMYASSKDLAIDPYVEIDLTNGQSKTTTQVYQIPVDSDMSTLSVTWGTEFVTVEGTVTFV